MWDYTLFLESPYLATGQPALDEEPVLQAVILFVVICSGLSSAGTVETSKGRPARSWVEGVHDSGFTFTDTSGPLAPDNGKGVKTSRVMEL